MHYVTKKGCRALPEYRRTPSWPQCQNAGGLHQLAPRSLLASNLQRQNTGLPADQLATASYCCAYETQVAKHVADLPTKTHVSGQVAAPKAEKLVELRDLRSEGEKRWLNGVRATFSSACLIKNYS